MWIVWVGEAPSWTNQPELARETLSGPPRPRIRSPHAKPSIGEHEPCGTISWRYLTARRPRETTLWFIPSWSSANLQKTILTRYIISSRGIQEYWNNQKQWRPDHGAPILGPFSSTVPVTMQTDSFKIRILSQLHPPAQIQSRKPRGSLCQPPTSIQNYIQMSTDLPKTSCACPTLHIEVESMRLSLVSDRHVGKSLFQD